ncbi:thioredoxin domain-containing protein [Nocardiopsis sp. MG754419]|uniref:DsbA family protein n=1 Tax=Nocardiopsis sp. MG754419 TaxID=2259865 RepID=UPI001BA53BB5|nr:thioredoxin domain-containing protein [Nocardiopsis sp. MG754419]MBR8740125.1 disulfide bond formation protein DsbA [Nocardiopsis sp. MG754419]
MNKNLTISLSLLAAVALVITLAAFLATGNDSTPGTENAAGPRAVAPDEMPTVDPELLVREDSRHLDEVDGARVTVVEFLDFECEACYAQYPVMERVRQEYDGRIDFVIRYFPLPGHANAVPAAAAVEAAAQQGELEQMYARMFATQPEWGESQESQVAVFEGFARDLGLDMDEFTETMNSPETAERVQADFDDGVEAGVQGTPTIYVNGARTSSMPTFEELSSMIDVELAE